MTLMSREGHEPNGEAWTGCGGGSGKPAGAEPGVATQARSTVPCLLEYVSVLAGQRFSDHPSCTHPALAELARQVNDLVSAAGRSRLARWAPALIGTAGECPGATAAVVAACARARSEITPANTELQRTVAAGDLRFTRQTSDGRPGDTDHGDPLDATVPTRVLQRARRQVLAWGQIAAARNAVRQLHELARGFDRVEHDEIVIGLLEQAVVEHRRRAPKLSALKPSAVSGSGDVTRWTSRTTRRRLDGSRPGRVASPSLAGAGLALDRGPGAAGDRGYGRRRTPPLPDH